MKQLCSFVLLFTALLTSSLLLNSCGSSISDPPIDTSKGTTTAVGTPVGSPVSATIDASGGTLISPDGRLEVIIPANALSASTAITIQPITNEAPLGAGLGFSLLPHGQQFSQPVTLRFHYTANELLGTDAKALVIAMQKADRIWYALDDIILDPAAGTLSATTKHFSDYNVASRLAIDPPQATIGVNRSLPLKLSMLMLAPDDDPDDELTPLVYVPTPILAEVNWSINGDLPGNQNDGTVSPRTGSVSTTYTAPSSIQNMSTNPVAVSATVQHLDINEKLTVISNITVTSGSGVGGTVSLTLNLNDSRTRTQDGMVEVKSEIGAANLIYQLPHIALTENFGSRDANWDDAGFNGTSSQTSEEAQTYDLICNGGIRKTITNRKKTHTIYEGGKQVTGAGITIADDGTYTIMLGPSTSLSAAASTYTTWNYYCEQPEQMMTTPSQAPVPFAPYFIPYIGGGVMKTTGKIDPQNPNTIRGTYHGTDQLTMFSFGTETITMPVNYTITWDLTLVP